MEAIQATEAVFPFPGYMATLRHSYVSVARHACRHLPAPARVLDVGCGPCDKTAVLSRLGYQCWAIDDLQDEWYLAPGNRERIEDFARSAGIQLFVGDLKRAGEFPEIGAGSFEMVMLHDIVEHFHDSPLPHLNRLIDLLKIGGLLFVTVPNAANLRKRLLLATGKTNYPRLEAFLFAEKWRGHVREYVLADLERLAIYLGLERVVLEGSHHRLNALPAGFHALFIHTFGRIHGLRDTLTLIGRKPAGWKPYVLAPEMRRAILARETPYSESAR